MPNRDKVMEVDARRVSVPELAIFPIVAGGDHGLSSKETTTQTILRVPAISSVWRFSIQNQFPAAAPEARPSLHRKRASAISGAFKARSTRRAARATEAINIERDAPPDFDLETYRPIWHGDCFADAMTDDSYLALLLWTICVLTFACSVVALTEHPEWFGA
jgi:hypothetical protein